ncbi:MAG: hypothetical protein US82_C0043G0001, partial [Parcubacteria group bacterium GW2011_GWC1_38_22]
MNDFINKINLLPPQQKEFFLSDVLMFEMKKSFTLCGMDSSLSSCIAKEVGDIFLGSLDLKELPRIIHEKLNYKNEIIYFIAYEINKRIFNKFPDHFINSLELLNQWETKKGRALITEEQAYEKMLKIEPWILELENDKKRIENKEVEKKEKEQIEIIKNTVTFSMNIALDKYPKIGEQTITSNPIKLQNFLEPVRPSVKNWITDFHYAMGSGKHSPIDRGNYLFHGENGKVLSAAERQKIGVILKSLDEQTLLTIDPEKEIIIFENEQSSRENTVSINREMNQIVDAGSDFETRPNIVSNKIEQVNRQEIDSKKTWIPDPMPAVRQDNDMVSVNNNGVNLVRENKFPQSNDNITVNQKHDKIIDLKASELVRPVVVSESPSPDPMPTGRQEVQNDIIGEGGNNGNNRNNNFRNSEPTARQDKIGNFYSPKTSTESIPEKNEEKKPPVVLKNISFSPNFVAQPKPEKEKVEKLDHRREWTTPIQSITKQTAVAPKEEVFSIPGSKPPIGSAEYDVNKTFPLTQKSFPADVIPKQEHIEERYSNEDADSNVSINEENRDS